MCGIKRASWGINLYCGNMSRLWLLSNRPQSGYQYQLSHYICRNKGTLICNAIMFTFFTFLLSSSAWQYKRIQRLTSYLVITKRYTKCSRIDTFITPHIEHVRIYHGTILIRLLLKEKNCHILSKIQITLRLSILLFNFAALRTTYWPYDYLDWSLNL